MVKAEWKSILKNPLMIVVLIAIALIPAIYAGLFLNSMWDPYGEISNLPVAVVNNDVPYEYHEKELNVGQNLADELAESDSMAFNVVDADVAEKGLKNGTYYMVITIPEDFSECAATVMDDSPRKMQLSYETNPGKNYIAMKMSQSAIKTIKESLVEEVTKTYAETIFDSLVDVEDGFYAAADGTGQLLDGEDELMEGNEKISSNLEVLASSTLTFKSGSETLEKGLSSYLKGVAQVDDGIAALDGGIDTLQDSAVSGSKELADGADTLKSGVKSYTDGVSSAKSGSDTLAENNQALNQGLESVSNGVDSLKTGSTQLLTGVSTLQTTLDNSLSEDKVSSIQLAIQKLPELNAGIQQLNLAVNGDGTTENPGLELSGLTNSLTAVGENLTNVGTDVSNAGSYMTSASTDLTSAINSEFSQLGSDLTQYMGGNTAYLSNITTDLTVLNSLYGTDNLKATLSSQGIYNYVSSIVDTLPQSSGVAGNLAQAGNELTNTKTELESAGGVLTGLSGSDLGTQVGTLKTSVQTIAKASEQLLEPSADALSSLLGGLQGVQTALDMTQEKNGSTGIVEGMSALNSGIASLQTGIDSEKGLKNSVKSYTDGVATLNQGLSTLESNNLSLTNGASQISSGASRLYTGLDSGISALNNGSNQLVAGSSKLVANNAALSDGASALTNGAEKIADGADQLADGSVQVGDGLTALQEGTQELNDALTDGAEEVADNEATDANIEMFSAPVELEETQITTVKNNGHGMTAYMLTVGLWVGCLAFCLMYPLAKYSGKFENGRKWWLSKASILYLLSILQALIVLLVLKVALGFEPQRWPLTILVTILASQTFMAIMYFFNVLMGKVGSFLMLIFMVLQLAGSAGTYPVEISGSMVAAIHKFVPFTYSVDAFRSTISGGEPVYHEMFVLLMIGLIFTGLTILVFWHRGKRIKANKPTLYDWIEVHGLA